MADVTDVTEDQIQAQDDEDCGDACVIDLSKIQRRTESNGGNSRATLIVLTRGTYGHHDDAFSAVQVGNALLAEEERATLLLVEDGVYLAVKAQNPSALGLPNNLNYVEDFLELGGRIVAVESALRKRGLTAESLVEGVEVAPYSRLVKEMESHAVSVTF